MPATYFKSEKNNLYILIIYSYLKGSQIIVLHQIKFFNCEEDIIDFIKINKFQTKKNKTSIEENILREFVKILKEYLSGKEIDLFERIKCVNIELDLEESFSTEFALKVVEFLLKSTKYGELTTYSELGKAIGSKAYRAIGNILKKNPIPLIIPCHRVIRKNGEIGGYMGKTDNSWQQNLKYNLIEMERQN